ncbi:MAG TPA: hypothetical protein VKY33_06040 [Flavobacterium sp.]|nr:hypothetical protein [Flavobacterium sp.]
MKKKFSTITAMIFLSFLIFGLASCKDRKAEPYPNQPEPQMQDDTYNNNNHLDDNDRERHYEDTDTLHNEQRTDGVTIP